jgi:hypothetical protein
MNEVWSQRTYNEYFFILTFSSSPTCTPYKAWGVWNIIRYITLITLIIYCHQPKTNNTLQFDGTFKPCTVFTSDFIPRLFRNTVKTSFLMLAIFTCANTEAICLIDQIIPPTGDSIFLGHIVLWPESASEIYPPSDRRLSANLVPTFCRYRVPRDQCDRSLWPYSRISRPVLGHMSIYSQKCSGCVSFSVILPHEKENLYFFKVLLYITSLTSLSSC